MAREAFNLTRESSRDTQVRLLVTLATPFGGQRSTEYEIAEGAYVAPVWQDLQPGSRFMLQLLRTPLPSGTLHAAAYAYLRSKELARGTAHDGVVPVSSQLSAHAELARVEGFQVSHSGILRDPAAIHWVLSTMDDLMGFSSEEVAPALATRER